MNFSCPPSGPRGGPVFNFRSEGRSFANSNRCLIPATAFFEFAGKKYPAASHVPALIYPSPLNPTKYVVLNSGFTFREYDYLSNARQTPKLPDWAIVDTSVPPDGRFPGKIVDAGFFNEDWK